MAVIASGFSLFAFNGESRFTSSRPAWTYDADAFNQQGEVSTEITAPADSSSRYPVKKTQVTDYEDLNSSHPIDLRDPSNIQNTVEYDHINQIYLFKTKIGDGEWETVLTMTPKEYNEYIINRSMSSFFKSKYQAELEHGDSVNDFSLKDIKISLGPAERIFGPGGVRIRTQGYAETGLGFKHNKYDDPSLTENNRSQTLFDFDMKVQMNIKASVGDKVNFDMNYDTETTFDFDSKKLKLGYEGKEDEILKRLEAGNVSMSTTNSLINGGAALFGIRADLQFGKLKISSVISQQESQSQTVNSKGGVQTMPFEFSADKYDENRHFFLGFYFRDNYNKAMSTLPVINSPVTISDIEVWITNKRSNFEQARNVIAFADLAESDSIFNFNSESGSSNWTSTGRNLPPNNRANNLYSRITTEFSEIRDITKVTDKLNNSPLNLQSGLDYEKIENAYLLPPSQYKYNAQTGCISLNTALQSDQVLAVAYKYKINGEEYRVGEFSSDIPLTNDNNSEQQGGALILKLLKPVSMSPVSYSWHLMMKNVYSLGAYQVQKEKFKLNIQYQNDTTGTYTNYISEGNIKDKILLQVMNLDRLNSRNNPHPDGVFDFIDGLTIDAANGRITFPLVEPFGKDLRAKIGNDAIADNYVYQSLYDSTLTIARQDAERNKFRMIGEYKASNNSQIYLNATNVAPGSVVVTAGGVTLMEGSDYTVDYTSGYVNIINSQYIDSNVPISVSLENRSFMSMQRKTMLGLNLSYDFSKDFTIGGTFMHMYEKPMTTKTAMGNEALKNTLWGLNAAYRTQSQWLTNLVDKLPFYNATAPSSISFTGEFAHMIPGHYENKVSGGYSYLDDFESSQSNISLMDARSWFLSSTPAIKGGKTEDQPAYFSEAFLSDDVAYGKNRAHLSWFNIDYNVFLRRNSTLTPQHIKDDKNQLSNHFVRDIPITELYPNRDISFNETAALTAFNLSYYPNERGMYNLDGTRVNKDGTLMNPKDRWGGIMRRLDNKDFEAANVEYIEFWLMDPFVYKDKTDPELGGDLYFNLGEVSEDILKDGRKFYENGLPIDGDPTAYAETNWGRVPTRQSTVYAFDNTDDATRAIQDVGYNGLNSEQEKEYRFYKTYLEDLERNLDASTVAQMKADPFSPFNDPAGDNYHYYRGSDYDRDQVSILDRYKKYNGTEGNSVSTSGNDASISRKSPDVEDIDQTDNTMTETESFFQYKVSLRPKDLEVGKNNIVNSRNATVTLRNGDEGHVTWYQFKVPIRENYRRIGTINDFKSIRFMRMFMTEFNDTTFLRFGSFNLVRGDWRTYSNTLKHDNSAQGNGTISVTTVNIEENGDREPVNYIMPPGVTRITDPAQTQIVQENEQAMSLKIDKLDPTDSRAIYKNTSTDLRRYKRLQMFTHAEEVIGSGSSLSRGDLSVFLRLGSDYKNNYYEYEIPLMITPAGSYQNNSTSDRHIVWPEENMFDFPLELLKNIKLNRNKEKRKAGSTITFTSLYSEYAPGKPNNKVSVVGNPSLSEIKVMMIGVRNKSGETKSGEVWINEMRLTDFDEEGGWAAQGTLNVTLSDLASINVSGRKETAGFGALDQSLMERRNDDLSSYNISTNIDVGKLLPEKVKATIPVYYTYSNQTVTPKYDPLDQDVTMKEALAVVSTKAEKDSIKSLAQDKTVTKTLSVSNAKLNIASKKPMPYDPANFSFTYSYSETEINTPTTVYDVTKDYRASIAYSYSPSFEPWTPFKNIKSKAPMSKFAKSLAFNYLPNNISFNSSLIRNYNETSLRDLDSYVLGEDNSRNEFLTTWSQNFIWDRDFSLNWDFTKNLKFSFQSGTQAEINENNLQVNKKLAPDAYDEWKELVAKEIWRLGTPLNYRQTAKLTYNLPFTLIPALDWITGSTSYEATYKWDRGADAIQEDGESEIEVGNTISNTANYVLNGRLNMVTLYNKWDFLKKVNQKFEKSTSKRNNQRNQAARKTEKKRFEKELELDSVKVEVKHNLNTKNIRVTAKLENGKAYPVKFKKKDNNTIELEAPKQPGKIKLSVVQGPDPEENTWYKVAQYTARGLMSLRSVSLNYTRREDNSIYGFRPMVGDAFGQGSTDYGLAPGLGFAFGFEGGEKYVNKLLENGQLIDTAGVNINPAIFNMTERFDIKAQLEPIKGLKIDLSALREVNERTELQFMYAEMPRTLGGSFAQTTIAISSALRSGSSKNGYASEAFDKLLENRAIIRDRLENRYTGVRYPDKGFLKNNLLGEYDPKIGSVSQSSSDVLIPAFLAAYLGKDANKIALTPFPSMSSMLPNWTISYDGLLDLIPSLKKKLKSLKFTHGYTAQYRVSSYTSHSDWVSAGKDIGFTKSTLTENPMPSSPYNISSVSITEAFNPLFGAEGTLNNSMTLRARFNNSRTVALNTSSYQIVENFRNEFVFGMGYKIANFNRVIGIKDKPGSSRFSNDLNVSGDISYNKSQALIRKIEEGYTQATSGTSSFSIKVSADYTLSRMLTLKAYFDRIVNTPLISSSSYPTTNTNFGISLRFTLSQ
nr:cell surface protein SprA [Dysgonomonas sp. 520]